jgi:ectoine hydroxylase-related dioxygenase (phytanoyl-CoA dioxygenase family)
MSLLLDSFLWGFLLDANKFAEKRSATHIMGVDEFDYTTNPKADEIVASLVHNGGCIVRNLITDCNVLEKIENDVRPHIETDRPWVGVDFFPPETRRVMGLIGKSRTFTETIPINSLYRDVCSRLLCSTYRSWYGYQLNTTVSEPQLSNTIVFSIGPGAKRQELHRDDSIHHNQLPELASYHDYRIGRDTSVGLFVAGKKTTKANGATRFIPGSHLWGEERCPDEDLAYYAELQPGDAFLMLASCYHGGSANTTADEERLVYSCFMTKGFLRQVCSSSTKSCLFLLQIANSV